MTSPRRRALGRGLLVLAALALCAAAPPRSDPAGVLPTLPAPKAATDDDRARASSAYDLASKAFGQGRLGEALIHASAAFEALPNASTALIRATVLDAMARHRRAFETYLVARDLAPTDAELELVLDGLRSHGRAMVPAMGFARIEAVPAGAQINVADLQWRGLRTVGLRAGRHVVRVTADGHGPTELVVDVAPGVGVIERVVLARLAPSPLRPRPQPIAPPAADDDLLEWTLIGAGSASVMAGLVMHLLAFGEAHDAEALAQPSPTLSESVRRRRYDDARSATSDFETGAWVLYGVGLGALGVGAALLVLDDSPATSPSVHVTPMGSSYGAGLSLRGGF